jgi:hypothetical protein
MSLKPHFTKQLYMCKMNTTLFQIELKEIYVISLSLIGKPKRKFIQDIIDTLHMINKK